jgi:hypothetical protein
MSSQNGEFAYEIYFYNKFNGEYEILKDGTSDSSVTDSVYISAMSPYYNDEPGWELQANRYYLRLHYNKNNTSDKLISVSIEHSHSYNDSFDAYSAVQHKAYCECGEYVLQDHSYTEHEKISNTHHLSTCACGYSKTSRHVITSSTATLVQCLKYGAWIDQSGPIIGIGTKPIQYITENGSYIRPDGIIVLVDEDVQAYLNGELIFYNPNDNLETQ